VADIPVLTDGVVTLRAHQVSDVDDIVTQCADPDSIEWTTVPTPYDRSMAESYVTTAVPEGWRTRRDLNFAIESTHPDGTRRFSGSISLRPLGEGVAEIAFGLHPAVRGKGVCSRAVELILDWGFQQQEIEVVTWYAYVGNWSSWRVAWANGFTFHGSIKKFLPQRGQRRDCWSGTLRAGDTREPKHKWHVAPTLESDRLRMRPMREDDGQRYWDMMHDSRNLHFAGRNTWLSEVESPAHLVRRAMENNARGDRYDWAIADPATDRFIGHIQIFGLAGLDETEGEIGYAVHPEARGKGVLTEALGMLVEWSFRPKKEGGQGLRRLSLDTAESNKASRYGAEKAGFTHVATLPEAFPTGETTFEGSATYHRLNPAWDFSWLD
jgi:RimJ/RimL family protein N-acetyltransferase